MENVKNILKNNQIKEVTNLNFRLQSSFEKALENVTFKKLISTLKLPQQELRKYTTKLEQTCCELNHCKKCKNVLECKNEVEGYVYYPNVSNDDLIFSFVACRYKREIDKKNAYYDNIKLFNMPTLIREATMQDIDVTDASRIKTIKWIKKFIDDYQASKPVKGLYLTGNFGCGKTYLLSAMLNFLAKAGSKVVIVYYPEFLRTLKSSFGDDSYDKYFNTVKKAPLLLFDDIGADTTTAWSRDEVLGTILQYRMQEKLPTFFTSNLSIKQLEEHLSSTKDSVDQVKSRRIIERIKQLTEEITMIGENKRK